MNSYSILNIVAATPLEQFQILPLSVQVYPAAATLTSLEEANLFPQLVGTDLVYATSSCAGSAGRTGEGYRLRSRSTASTALCPWTSTLVHR